MKHTKALPSEALYMFCGWLTTREERTIMSAGYDAAPVAELVNKFVTENNLEEPRDDWHKVSGLKHPKS